MIQPRSGKVTFTHKIRVFGSTLGETSIYTKKKKKMPELWFMIRTLCVRSILARLHLTKPKEGKRIVELALTNNILNMNLNPRFASVYPCIIQCSNLDLKLYLSLTVFLLVLDNGQGCIKPLFGLHFQFVSFLWSVNRYF